MFELSVRIGTTWYTADDLYGSRETATIALTHIQKQTEVDGFRIVRSA